MYPKNHVLTALITLVFMCASVPVSAQDSEEPGPARQALGVGILTVLMTSLGVMTSMRRGEQSEIDRLNKEIKELQEIAALDDYMDGMTHELQDAIVLGDERTLRDIAELMHVSTTRFPSWREQVMSRRGELFEALSMPEPHAMIHETYHLLQFHSDELPAAPCVQVSLGHIHGVQP
jgi:hypothetical protein